MANPWDIFAREPKGDDKIERIYQAVGFALTQWELLESALANLYSEIIGFDSHAAIAAYGTVASNAGRLEMILAAADGDRRGAVHFVRDDLRSFVSNEVVRLLGRRNEIAHGMVVEFVGSPQGQGHYLVPPNYNTRKRHPLHTRNLADMPFGEYKYAYTALQVEQYGNWFWTYANKTYALLKRLQDARAMILKARGPEGLA
jgi:hypothetical protein